MNMHALKYSTMLILFIMDINLCFANAPALHFSDIDTGPSSGLDDGLGEGTIVTIWGSNLGSTQGASSITLTNTNGSKLSAAHIYYWKDADGSLPGGPANLFQSHKFQEVSFSIPTTVTGNAEITVTVDGVSSNSLPFKITNVGNIYWIAPTGNNSNDCSYSSPCAYINANIKGSLTTSGIGNGGRLQPGDIVYSKGVQEPEFCSGDRCIGLFFRGTNGTKDNLISIVAYPGTRPQVVAKDVGMEAYLSSYISLTKYSISVGSVDPSLPPNPGSSVSSDTHIRVDRGRYVGNYLSQNPGSCITGWSGSITSGGNGGENARILGNEIDSLGCPNTSRFQHTTYMSIRNESSTLTQGWEYSYNYLHDNYPMFGIHFYDEQINSGDCGNLTGTLKVTHNVITNQWGSGINIATRDSAGTSNICWAANIVIENNLLINTGLGEPLDDNVTPPPIAIRIGGNLAPNFITIKNNTVYEWGSATSLSENGGGQGLSLGLTDFSGVNPLITIQNNAFKSNIDYPFVDISETVDIASNNAFYSSASTHSNDSVPEWGNSIVTDPKITISNGNLILHPTSPLRDAGVDAGIDLDLYGNIRGSSVDIGAVEYFTQPLYPTNVDLF